MHVVEVKMERQRLEEARARDFQACFPVAEQKQHRGLQNNKGHRHEHRQDNSLEPKKETKHSAHAQETLMHYAQTYQ